MANARDAFYKILKTLDFGKNKKILLPSYIGVTEREGSGVFDPIKRDAVPYQLYTLDKRLSAFEDELYKLITSGNYCALLIIHYFGFCQNDMGKIISLCINNNVVLIEDCAHSMMSEIKIGKLGSLGDFSIFSIHKFLASMDGGCLQVNNSSYLYLLKETPDTIPKNETVNLVANSNYNLIRQKRRRNYIDLVHLIGGISRIKVMFSDLPDGISPHNLPIIILDGKREEVYFKLIDSGIPVIALYYKLINPILDGYYPDSKYISDNILNLPIHQDMETEDIKKVAQKLITCINK